MHRACHWLKGLYHFKKVHSYWLAEVNLGSLTNEGMGLVITPIEWEGAGSLTCSRYMLVCVEQIKTSSTEQNHFAKFLTLKTNYP